MGDARKSGKIRLFAKTVPQFVSPLRKHALELGIAGADKIGTHALRRGMARDILDAGGSLATLLLAGDWQSSAFIAYLRENHLEEKAVAGLVIDHSDSE